jgi:hypothetical protein
MAIILGACAPTSGSLDTTVSGTGDTVTGSSASLTDSEYLVDVRDVADSYAAPEDPPYDSRSLERVEWLSYCLAAFGFQTTVVTEPGAAPTLLGPSLPHAQLELWAAADEMCSDEAVARGWFTPIPISPDELRAEYRHLVEVNECLTDLGYGTDPPSEERFVEEREWNVYANTPMGAQLLLAVGLSGEVVPPDVKQQLAIQAACPIWAPTE